MRRRTEPSETKPQTPREARPAKRRTKPRWNLRIDGDVATFRKDARERTQIAAICLFFGLVEIACYFAEPEGSFKFFVLPYLPNYVLVWIGLTMSLPAALFLVRRDYVVIDRRKSMIRTYYKIGWQIGIKEIPFSQVDAITIDMDAQIGGRSRILLFNVSLLIGRRRERLARPRTYAQAWKLAERLALFLNTPIKDTTSGETVEYSAQDIFEACAARELEPDFHGGSLPVVMKELSIPDPPEGTEIKFRSEEGCVILELPQEGRTWHRDEFIYHCVVSIPFTFFGLVVLPWVILVAMRPPLFEGEAQIVIGINALFLGGALLLIARYYWLGKTKDTLELGPDELIVRRRRPLERLKWRFRYSSLEATISHPQTKSFLAAPPKTYNCSLTVFDDRQGCTFGRTMTMPEAEWVLEVIGVLAAAANRSAGQD